ncbi:MAG: PIN domain-containing protein [Nocardioidaceae bacterium]
MDYPAAEIARHAEAAAVSDITLAELVYGLHTADPLVNAAREQRYQWIVSTFDPIPFGTQAARTYGDLCASVRAAGRDPKPRRFDLLIAAVAVAIGTPLLTRNPGDFRDIHGALAVVSIC